MSMKLTLPLILLGVVLIMYAFTRWYIMVRDFIRGRIVEHQDGFETDEDELINGSYDPQPRGTYMIRAAEAQLGPRRTSARMHATRPRAYCLPARPPNTHIYPTSNPHPTRRPYRTHTIWEHEEQGTTSATPLGPTAADEQHRLAGYPSGSRTSDNAQPRRTPTINETSTYEPTCARLERLARQTTPPPRSDSPTGSQSDSTPPRGFILREVDTPRTPDRMALNKICLVGANGNLGSVLLPALISADFQVTVLQRESSTSKVPSADHPNVTVKAIDPDFALPDLIDALRGHDAVIATFPFHGRLDNHLRLAYAAAQAGVRRFIPADFGSCDATHPEALKRLQLYRDKVRVRERCEELAREFASQGFSWTALVCGHFFDWGLRENFLHFDLDKREAWLLDGGNLPASTSTLSRVAEAVVAVLRRPEETANKTLFVQSFNPTPRQVLAALEKATGGAKWTVREVESGPFLEEEQKKVDGGDRHAIEEVVFVLGAMDADWTKKPGFAMQMLGLKDEDLDQVVKKVVEEREAAKAA